MLFPSQIISILMGDVGREVLGYARIYLLISSLVLPFTAIFCVCAATYRAQGNTRVPMLASVMILLISFVCKYLFSTVLPLGVEGTALANLIANVVVAAGLMLAMRKKSLRSAFGAPTIRFWRRTCSARSFTIRFQRRSKMLPFRLD